MISFRCWYCNKHFSMPEQRIGTKVACSCKSLLRVPRRSGGYCRVKSLADWLVEAIVYGGGGALLGFGLSLLLLSQARFLVAFRQSWALIAGLTIVGFVAGLLGGERGVNFIGQMIRDRENS